jgi:glyoxylase-like metal-dependent hydrolase (beta-lactamase superfamily II)
VNAPAHEQIDLLHLGRPDVICCHRLGDVLIDPGPQSCEQTLVAALGSHVPRAILLTHIHLDHAGAAGALAQRWPQIRVAVHERGARHLADPSRLIASARRLYGDDMERLWGEIVPVPEERLIVLRGGETLDELGGEGPWEVAYTPGHAQHHVAYLHRPSRTVFAGDVAGVRIADGPVMPPTPPPDIDLELWQRSLDTVAAWGPRLIAVTHFGAFGDTERHVAELRESLRRLGEWSHEDDAERFERRVRDWIEGRVGAEHAAAYFQGMPPDALYPGLERYWRTRAQS